MVCLQLISPVFRHDAIGRDVAHRELSHGSEAPEDANYPPCKPTTTHAERQNADQKVAQNRYAREDREDDKRCTGSYRQAESPQEPDMEASVDIDEKESSTYISVFLGRVQCHTTI